jgi:excisionase family DNA binding protein
MSEFAMISQGQPISIFSVDEVAALLRCSAYTVEEAARSGDLPGIKPGGSWIFPSDALQRRLNEKALEEAAARRSPGIKEAPRAVAVQPIKPTRGRQRTPIPACLREPELVASSVAVR